MNDATFDSLADERRRTLLVALLDEHQLDATAPIPVDDGAGAVNTERRMQAEMYHRHLPKLADQRFIDWDRDTDEIVKGPQFEELRPLLEVVAPHVEN